jgi:hypothetical protein
LIVKGKAASWGQFGWLSKKRYTTKALLAMQLANNIFFSARIGALVKAIDKSADRIIHVDFPKAEDLLSIMISNGTKISRDIANKCTSQDIKILNIKSIKEKFPNLIRSKTERTSRVLTAVDFNEMVVNFKSSYFLVRPSFTVCASGEGKGSRKPDSNYSKIWIRVVELNVSKKLSKITNTENTYINSSATREDINSLMNIFLNAALLKYQNILSSYFSKDVEISADGKLEIFSSDVPLDKFNALEYKLFENNTAKASEENRYMPNQHSDTFTKIANSFIKATNLPASDYQDVFDDPRRFMDRLRSIGCGNTYKLIAIDDDAGNVGYYVGKIHDQGASFVGVSRLNAIISADEGKSNYRPSKAPSNVVSAMLANDLVIGL